MFDPVNRPAHYAEGRKFEPIDVIEDWGLSYHLGNALKYVSRAGRKDPANTRQDISKAIWYLERFQDQLDSPIGSVKGEINHEELQNELEFQALGEIPNSVLFGSDEDYIPFDASDSVTTFNYDGPLYAPHPAINKDLSKFKDDQIVMTEEVDGQILGHQKNGDVRILKHRDDLYDQLPSDVEPSYWPQVNPDYFPKSDT